MYVFAKIIDVLSVAIGQRVDKENESVCQLSEYGAQLFNHFCAHPKRTWITIQSFDKLPLQLTRALGVEFTDTMDLSRLQRTFPAMTELTLNELDLQNKCEQLLNVIDADLDGTRLTHVVL